MRTNTKLAAAALAACAACCAISVVPPIFVGSGLLAVRGIGSVWAIALAAITVTLSVHLFGRRKATTGVDFNALMATASCGCGDSCGTVVTTEEPIACTLGASDFRERTEHIRAMASRSLRRAVRDGLSLSLTYAPDALAEVQDLVTKERRCCAFLSFDLRHDHAGVYLTITAPHSAADAADLLFDHFAPELVLSTK